MNNDQVNIKVTAPKSKKEAEHELLFQVERYANITINSRWMKEHNLPLELMEDDRDNDPRFLAREQFMAEIKDEYTTQLEAMRLDLQNFMAEEGFPTWSWSFGMKAGK